MRILFISAFYPPYVIGGWEQLVQDINLQLQARGHITHVLTSSYGVAQSSQVEPGVERTLSLESDQVHYKPLDFFTRRSRQIEQNLAAVRAAIQGFNPDVVFIHVMWNLSRRIAWLAEQLYPERVVYYIANDWPYAPDTHTAYWLDPAQGGARRVMKRIFAPHALKALEQEARDFPLKFERVLCVSQAIKKGLADKAGIPVNKLRVVYNGVEIDQFVPADRQPCLGELSLLYAGSLVTHKGVHTAVEAMALLAQKPSMDKITLTLVGSGNPEYEARLKTRVAEAALSERVRFWPRVSREEMPALFRKFDVLVFPSIWQEPLARVMQEAMASGLVVVGTLTGGSPEILIEGETGLTFEAGDAAALARRIEDLSQDVTLRHRLAYNARQLVHQKFDLRRMIDEIEASLREAVSVSSQQAGR